MKIDKIQEPFLPFGNFASGPALANTAANSRDEATERISKNANIAKLNALAEHIITEANALIIEKNPNGSGFIYKSIDRSTGEIVRIWPREEVIGMLEATFEGAQSGGRVNKIA